MTVVTLSSSETRHAKALAILAQRGQWLTGQLRDGSSVIGVPSQTKKGLVHLVAPDGSRCDCYDFSHSGRSCKHSLAVKLDRISRGPEQPASDAIRGLQAMAAERDVFARL